MSPLQIKSPLIFKSWLMIDGGGLRVPCRGDSGVAVAVGADMSGLLSLENMFVGLQQNQKVYKHLVMDVRADAAVEAPAFGDLLSVVYSSLTLTDMA
jgi:hypothetical protein